VRSVSLLLAGFAVVAAGCGSGVSDEILTAEAYVASMQAFEESFRSGLPDPNAEDPTDEDYPLGGDLVFATKLYGAYEDLLAGWESVSPPEEFEALHTEMVDALDGLQKAIGSYLGDEALASGELNFQALAGKFRSELLTVRSACARLQGLLDQSDAGKVFSDCTF
jgi:hypothetical protein